ncbi:MAG: hypothetical protein ACE5KI_01355 [Dehalococcoidia bacterium]
MAESATNPEDDPRDQGWSWVLECDGESLERMRKRAEIKHDEITFTINCDEGTDMGGDNSAPWPLDYLVASLLF